VSAVGSADTKRERLAAAACVAAGAGLMLLAVSRTWVHAVADDPLAGRLAVDATGRQAAPVVAAVALVALAGAVAILTVRTIGRLVAGLLLVLAAGAAGAAALGVARTPSDALRSVLSDATGRSGGPLPVAQHTVWPWVAFAGTLLVLLTLAYAVASRRWALLLLMPVFGYAFAWVGHFFVEGNRPATFQYPLYSLAGDFRMFADMLRGRVPF